VRTRKELGLKLTLELREVEAARMRVSRSLRSTGVDISVRYSTALEEARWKDSAMRVGWIPATKERGGKVGKEGKGD